MGKSGPTELTKAEADDDASVLSFFLNELLCLFDWIDAYLRAPFHLGRRRLLSRVQRKKKRVT